MSMLLITVFTV